MEDKPKESLTFFLSGIFALLIFLLLNHFFPASSASYNIPLQ